MFPIIALVAFKLFKQHFLTVLVGLSLLSIQFAEWMEIINPDLNFYLPFSRFWELAVGSILAYRELNYKVSDEGIGKRILPMIGLYLVVYSILFFDGKTPHPSFHTLIPVVGVALIIGFSSKDELVGKFLGSKPFVNIGLISYSLYLWHFPVFAFARVKNSELTNHHKLYLLLFVFMLSFLSYKLIEKPMRNRLLISRRLFISSFILLSVVIISLCSIAKYFDGFPNRFPAGWVNFELDKGVLSRNFWKYFDENRDSLSRPMENKINVYVFGNSHSGDLLGALFSQSQLYEKYHFLKSVKQEELPCLDERDSRFEKQRKALYESDAYKKADVFIVATRFKKISHCYKPLKNNPDDEGGLNYLIPKLQKDGKKVLILGNTLELNRLKGKWLAEKIYTDAVRDKADFRSFLTFKSYKSSSEKKAYKLQNKDSIEINRQLRDFALKNNLGYFERRKLFCNEYGRTCLVFGKDGHRLRYDSAHLTLEGKKVFGHLLKESNFERVLFDVWRNQIVEKSPYIQYGEVAKN